MQGRAAPQLDLETPRRTWIGRKFSKKYKPRVNPTQAASKMRSEEKKRLFFLYGPSPTRAGVPCQGHIVAPRNKLQVWATPQLNFQTVEYDDLNENGGVPPSYSDARVELGMQWIVKVAGQFSTDVPGLSLFEGCGGWIIARPGMIRNARPCGEGSVNSSHFVPQSRAPNWYLGLIRLRRPFPAPMKDTMSEKPKRGWGGSRNNAGRPTNTSKAAKLAGTETPGNNLVSAPAVQRARAGNPQASSSNLPLPHFFSLTPPTILSLAEIQILFRRRPADNHFGLHSVHLT
ncbi:hypothetical protein DFH09DRAFT_1092241 [Mycena vulgaris]|nr:hypothetical protein DFH09DRAFT_1092228 [Mycena vulgaris]KAJ6533865.1 hypothetical protein DFH09DRAFT_1092241 [Mycena vulgaris]